MGNLNRFGDSFPRQPIAEWSLHLDGNSLTIVQRDELRGLPLRGLCQEKHSRIKKNTIASADKGAVLL